MTGDQPPLEMYVVVMARKFEDDDEVTIQTKTYPFTSREDAEREADRMRDAYHDTIELQDEDDGLPCYEWAEFGVHRVLVPDGRGFERMDRDSWKSLIGAADAVAAGLVEDDNDGDRNER